MRPVFLITELITDFSIFLIFVSILFLVSGKSSFKKVHPIFGILFVVLLGINFLQFGGVEGTNCFNFYSGIYVIVMLYASRMLYNMIIFQLSFLALLIYLVFVNHPFYQTILISISETTAEFIFSLISISVFTFYLKQITHCEIKKSESKSVQLNQKVRESKKLNHQLMAQSEELKKAQEILRKEVNHRVEVLEKRKEAIEQYIHHNTTTLKDPLLLLSNAVSQLKADHQLHTLLKVSHAELNNVISSINQALQSEKNLDRITLEKNL